MNKYREQLNKCIQVIDSVRNMINVRQIPSNAISYNDLYSALYQLVPLIPEEFHIFRDRLRDKILPNLKTSDLISVNQFGQQLVTPQNGINPYSFGEVIATITYLNEYGNNSSSSIWDNIHPQIISVAKGRFDNEYYADAAEAAVYFSASIPVIASIRRIPAAIALSATIRNDPILPVALT